MTTFSIDGASASASSAICLSGDDAAAPEAAVGGDEQPGLLVVDAIAQRLGAEAAEHDAVHRADARAGEHRDGQLGDERQVDGDAIALLDAERLQDVGELADFAVEIEVGQGAAIARLAFPDERGLVAARPLRWRSRQLTLALSVPADEPLRVRRLPVEDAVPGPRPFELAGKLRPERFRIAFGLGVDRLVADVGGRLEGGGRWKGAVFAEQIVVFGVICGRSWSEG